VLSCICVLFDVKDMYASRAMHSGYIELIESIKIFDLILRLKHLVL
jgi:hypothetical protein